MRLGSRLASVPRAYRALLLAAFALFAAPASGQRHSSTASPVAAPATPAAKVVIIVDADDDDANGVADFAQTPLPRTAYADLVPVPAFAIGATLHPLVGGERARVIADGQLLPWDRVIPAGAALQGISVGPIRLAVQRGRSQETLEVDVRGVRFRDGVGGDVDPTRAHASLARTPPARVAPAVDAPFDDPDGLRVLLELGDDGGSALTVPVIGVESFSASGLRMDEIPSVAMAKSECLGGRREVRCFATPPLRFVADDVDRSHPLVVGRALRTEVGGAIVVRADGRKAQMIRVLGPRSSPVGPIGRLRAKVRPFVFRVAPGSAPAVGGTDAGAIASMRGELALASAVWGQCGVTFGDARAIDVAIVDPPPPFLIALGDDLGIPASGGEIRLRVDGKPVTITTQRGRSADAVAYDVARAVERAGLVPTVSPNARIGPAVAGSVDVLVRRRNGSLATVEAAVRDAPLTTDATLSVRIGSVDLSDGLQHFRDMDAVAGTLEERTLLKAIDDGDPRTVELVVVPAFAGGVRIGESFIGSDASSLRNAVILDRAGVRARRSSLTLAHELGHVLLDMPDHPDDYGADTPTLLMDSDASDASAFGPRRLTIDECARVVRESGPRARVPLLTEWPLAPLKLEPPLEPSLVRKVTLR